MSSPDSQVRNYEFIPLQDPAALRQISTVRLVRSHAARSVRQKVRLREQQLQQNFRVSTVKDMKARMGESSRSPRYDESLPTLAQPEIKMIDPFKALPRCSSRLQELLDNEYAKQAGEPVITFKSTTPFRSSKNLYQSCLTDPAFLNALMLSLAFAANGSQMTVECWAYRGEAMRHIASLMETDQTALSELTIGAILVLTGVEYRFRSPNSHATHMSGLAKILRLEAAQKSACLSDSTRRSIFWQDLNGAMISGSARLFDHSTFSALHWSRDQISYCEFTLPPGIERVQCLFSTEMITVLEDLNGFRLLRDSGEWDLSDLELLTYIDNAQAWNESRIFNIQRQSDGSLDPLVNCCLTGAYICSYSLFSEIWAGTFITSSLSTRLLHQLESSICRLTGDHESNLFLWLIFIGATASVDEKTRNGYVRLLQSLTTLSTCAKTWKEALAISRLFIWSDAVFLDRSHRLWTECQAAERLTAVGN